MPEVDTISQQQEIIFLCPECGRGNILTYPQEDFCECTDCGATGWTSAFQRVEHRDAL